MKLLITLAFTLFLLGCESPSLLSQTEYQTVEKAAERLILNSGLVSKAELKEFKTEDLDINYYTLSGDYTDYQIRWDINSNESILIVGRGDITTLQSSTITRESR